MRGLEEHAEAVENARRRLEEIEGRPLQPLPASFPATRRALHRLAEAVLKEKRVLETGGRIALCYTPGGFGTPRWERGELTGTGGHIRVEGVEVVLVESGTERRAAASDPEAAARLAGLEPSDGAGSESAGIDAEAAVGLADWFAYGTTVLAELIDSPAAAAPEPIRLWPEHFDVATVLGDEEAGSRANFGASPGDEGHPEPYLYVGPWVERTGELWNATGFPGAELSYAELLAANDPLQAGLEFMRTRLDALAAG